MYHTLFIANVEDAVIALLTNSFLGTCNLYMHISALHTIGSFQTLTAKLIMTAAIVVSQSVTEVQRA